MNGVPFYSLKTFSISCNLDDIIDKNLFNLRPEIGFLGKICYSMHSPDR